MSQAIVTNPILRGFNPDPSIIRVGDDYYIATSTFEWFPGVRIYHSRDLVSWELIATPLNRISQLNMAGIPDSCGVYAPCLSWSDGVFYLIYTNTTRFGGDFKDTPNYLVTTTDIRGDWSEPVYLNSSGFDPSLFHDDDGKKWLVNMVWDHRQPRNRHNNNPQKYFYGIVLQEYNPERRSLTGDIHTIFKGSPTGFTEGPHLYRRNGYYYLLTAEGGTGKNHAATFARSDELTGPYEVDPAGHIITSLPHPQANLRRAGHADIVDTPDGETYLVHLCSRPLPFRGRSVMGRETGIQKVTWIDDWPRLVSGTSKPEDEVVSTLVSESDVKPAQPVTEYYDFANPHLSLEMQSTRLPLGPDQMSFSVCPEHLSLYGANSPGSLYKQSLLARRQQAFVFNATTQLEFTPTNFQQMAGLLCFYNSKKFYYLHVTHDEQLGRILDLSANESSAHATWPLQEPINLPEAGTIRLKADVNYDLLTFSYAIDEGDWIELPVTLDYSVLSDEVGEGGGDANFTGAFVGIGCHDVSGQRARADFRFFEYLEQAE